MLHNSNHLHSCEHKQDSKVDADGRVEGVLLEVVGRVPDDVGNDGRLEMVGDKQSPSPLPPPPKKKHTFGTI